MYTPLLKGYTHSEDELKEEATRKQHAPTDSPFHAIHFTKHDLFAAHSPNQNQTILSRVSCLRVGDSNFSRCCYREARSGRNGGGGREESEAGRGTSL